MQSKKVAKTPTFWEVPKPSKPTWSSFPRKGLRKHQGTQALCNFRSSSIFLILIYLYDERIWFYLMTFVLKHVHTWQRRCEWAFPSPGVTLRIVVILCGSKPLMKLSTEQHWFSNSAWEPNRWWKWKLNGSLKGQSWDLDKAWKTLLLGHFSTWEGNR